MEMLTGDGEYWETYDAHIAFYKYGVEAIWFMFAVLKELSGFIYPISAVRGKKSKKFIEYSRKCSISVVDFKLYW